MVQVLTRQPGRFCSRPVQKPDPRPVGGQHPDPYPSTCWFCSIWLDPLGPISGSACGVWLFKVAFRYPTVNYTILTMVRCCSFWMHWPPSLTTNGETATMPHPGNECERSVKHFCSCILGNLSGDWLQIVSTEVLASFKGKRRSDTLPAPSWKWTWTECQRFKVSHLV